MAGAGMQVLLINPNTTESMTRGIGAAARSVAGRATEIIAVNPEDGPASIEGYYDEALSVPGLLDEIRKRPDLDAYIVACFDDSGLDAARSLVEAPVIGIGEAAYHMASLISTRFAVVTTLARSVPALEQNLVRYGLASRCVGVRAASVPVLELEQIATEARDRISAEIERAVRDSGAEAIVLGCAGMADLAASLARAHGLPVVDGVTAAVKLAEGLVSLGLKTSKLGGYAAPRPKAYTGALSRFAPKDRE